MMTGKLVTRVYRYTNGEHLLSGFHNPQKSTTVRRLKQNLKTIEVVCPRALVECNCNMNFVAKFDQMIARI